MIYIAHRINTIEQLKEVPEEFGVEVDIRDSAGELIMVHDPFSPGEKFENYLKHYKHKLIILNVKSERIEFKILELLKKYKIKNYFFLDSSFPMIWTLNKAGENNIALRFSEYEPIENILAAKDMAKWIWIDCFSKFPVDDETYKIIKSSGLKTCLVSPELQGRPEDLIKYITYIKEHKMVFDATCTKLYNIAWQTLKD
jgi:hypothetical protein